MEKLPPLKDVISRHQLRAKKSLGQNFLLDLNLTSKIARYAGNLDQFDILEIGPGPGGLTRSLLHEGARKVVAIEKDNRCIEALEEIQATFPGRLKLLQGDALSTNASEHLADPVRIIANLPYNIGTELLVRWLTSKTWPSFWQSMTLMFQKEVANRIISKFNTSTYGRLSILTNWKLKVDKICDIKPVSFSPKPKVDSSLLLFSPKNKTFVIKDPKNLEKVTRIFFRHRRKMLKKPFNELFNGDQKILERLKIDLNLRPQNLDFETYYQITREYENL